jgi:serine/threonine-protein kinase
LYTAHTNSVTFDDATIMVQLMTGGASKRILRGGYAARYVPSGHIAYLHEDALFVVPFDLERLETTGTPTQVIGHIADNAGSAGAQFSVSPSGALVYLVGGQSTNTVPLVWVDSKEKTEVMRAPGLYLAPRFSPDGRRLALQVFAQGGSKIWIYDWQRDVMSRLTDEMGDERDPLWSPDGQRIVFSSDREEAGRSHLYVKRVDSTVPAEQLTDVVRSEREYAGSWLPDGKTIAVSAIRPKGSPWDIIAVQVDRDSGNTARPEPKTILSASYGHYDPVISPNGKWLAYESLETGRREVYVRRFPELDHKEQISLAGGMIPIWSRAHNELFYRSSDGIMVVSYAPSAAEFNAGKPRVWSREPLANLDGLRNLDLHPDGERMVIVRAAETSEGVARDKAVLVLNFAAELRRIAPGAR